uniref:N-acetyltransferase domain-containing protein n=1 Tax=Ciona savignyi TaxID=51511 RepID=H2Z2D5_CIOSA
GDNYFSFTCSSCSGGKELYVRMKVTWLQVVSLALYNLAQTSMGKQGYFKWKEDICLFIDTHWESFFGQTKKKTTQWSCTVGSILSLGNPQHFQSGFGVFTDSGWWRLLDPTRAPEYVPGAAITSTPSMKMSFCLTSHAMMFITFCRMQTEKNPLHVIMIVVEIMSRSKTLTFHKQISKNKLLELSIFYFWHKLINHSNNYLCLFLLSPQTHKLTYIAQETTANEQKTPVDSPLSNVVGEPPSQPSSPCTSVSSAESKIMVKKEVKIDSTLPLVALSDDDSDADSIFTDFGKKDDATSYANHTGELGIVRFGERVKEDGKKKENKTQENNVENDSENLEQTYTPMKSLKYRDKKLEQNTAVKGFLIRPLNLYEERKLLKRLLNNKSVDDDVAARRLRRKLIVRQKQRQLGVSVFNFDEMVRRLHNMEQNLQLPQLNNQFFNPAMQDGEHRILDRFLSSDPKLYGIGEARRSFKQKLIGADERPSDQQLIVSPYTRRLLKPFIRRDYETRPPKLQVLNEIVQQRHKSEPTWQEEPAAPIDYCYVRPHHVPTINAMCRHFFWPGVDLSESLQYPDFSVVALYKKMVIGFGFLVPDVAFNETYISFLLVHPDWQQAGIGTFMLYHLMQTCMGKDVTLHVSASNPAMLLYQRFGFKPERFDANFYDKYMAPDDQECAHAFFMRLRR